MKNILAAILALLLITTACSPLPAKSTPMANKNVLFSDDFTDPKSGWDKFQDYAGVTDYANVGYLIYIKAANMIKWANPPKTFQNDIRIEVDTTMSFGPDNNAFGVICRYQDPDNFYYFYISSDGFGGIGKKQNGQHSIISSSGWQVTQGRWCQHGRGEQPPARGLHWQHADFVCERDPDCHDKGQLFHRWHGWLDRPHL